MRGDNPKQVVLVGETTSGIPLTISGLMFFRLRRLNMPDPNPPGQADKVNYEYTTYYVPDSHHHPDVIARMNELGAEGWLLVTASAEYMYFVRELK